jgi:hypothetical protein
VFNEGQDTFAPVDGSLILAGAKAVSESNRNAIEEAEAFRRPVQSWTAENSHAAFIYHGERDAIGTAMTIGDFDRSVLGEVVVPNAPDHFPTTQVGEDAIIEGDEFLSLKIGPLGGTNGVVDPATAKDCRSGAHVPKERQ